MPRAWAMCRAGQARPGLACRKAETRSRRCMRLLGLPVAGLVVGCSMPAGGFGGGGGSWMPMAMAVIGVLAAGRHSPGGREA